MNKKALLGSAALLLLGASQAHAQLIISEFRVRGPNGANDEFIELYNNSGADHTVAGGGTGYAVAASNGVARCVVPNGTVIPNRGHYLCVNSVGYSLASYPAGNGTTATGDATFTTDIPDNAGIAVFNTSVAVDFTLANRLDAVGSTSEANTLYKEGAGYAALTPFSIDYSFYRDTCGKGGSITTFGTCPAGNAVADSNDNAADFIFVDTNGTSAGAGQRLGAPGPQNLSSPIAGTAGVEAAPLDSCVGDSSPPNRVRDFTSDPANNSTFGTLDLRHTFTNTTGGNLTRLRFRIDDLTTFPAPSGIADLRPRTSTAVVVTVDRPPCGAGTSNVTVQGTTLEQPPSQPNGSGFNGSLSSGTITLATPLPNGATLDARFLLGIQQNGCFKFGISAETLPGGGFTAPIVVQGGTNGDAGCIAPTVVSITRVGANPTNAASVDFTVTFDSPVTGVDAADFGLTTTGTLAGASVTNVSGSNTTWTVTVATGTGDGTLRLDVLDSATINNTAAALEAGFTGGEAYDIDRTGPTATIDQALGQADPTANSPILFTVVFSEPVLDFSGGDVDLSGTANPATASVSGGPTTYTVEVSGMTANGTVIASLPAGVSSDALGNPISASTSTDNTVTYTGIDAVAPTVTINQAAGQADPTEDATIEFTAVFSEAVTGFDAADVVLGGTAGATTVAIAGGPSTYTVTVSGMTGAGTVTAGVAAGAADDAASNPSLASTSTDNSVTFQIIVPTATITQAPGQEDTTETSPVNFTVTFSEPVTGFTASDVVVGGTAGADTAVVTGGPTSYNVAVTGMTTDGTVTIDVPAAAAVDADGNPSEAASAIDNVVVFGTGTVVVPSPAVIPATSPLALLLLALVFAGIGVFRRRAL